MGYLSEAIGYLCIALKYGTLLFMLLYLCKFRKMQKTTFQTTMYYVFIIYVFTVLAITRVIGSVMWKPSIGSFVGFSFLELFSMEKLLNVMLFVPLGVFFPYFIKQKKWYLYVLMGAISSGLIECIQCFFVGRLADITDIVTNTLGCALGVAIFFCTRWLYRKFGKKKNIGIGSLSIGLNIVLLILSWPILMGKVCFGDILISKLLDYRLTWSVCNIHYMEFSGIHYTILYLFVGEIISFYLGYKNTEDLFAKAGKITAIIVMVYMLVLFSIQMCMK